MRNWRIIAEAAARGNEIYVNNGCWLRVVIHRRRIIIYVTRAFAVAGAGGVESGEIRRVKPKYEYTTISKSRNSTAHTQKPRPPEYIEFRVPICFVHGLVFPGRLIHLVASAIFSLLIPIGALGGSGCRGNCSRPISLMIHLDALPRQRKFPIISFESSRMTRVCPLLILWYQKLVRPDIGPSSYSRFDSNVFMQ